MLYKSTFSLLVASFLFLSLNAQTDKGTFMIGTNFQLQNYNFSSRGDFKNRKYNFELKAGRFFKDNLLLGTEFNFKHASNRNSTDLGYTGETINLGLFARKYIGIKDTKWKPFVEIGAGYTNYSFNYKSSIPTDILPTGNSSGAYGRAELGIAYFLKENLSINLSTYTQFEFGSGSDITLGGMKFGIHYHFKGKKKE